MEHYLRVMQILNVLCNALRITNYEMLSLFTLDSMNALCSVNCSIAFGDHFRAANSPVVIRPWSLDLLATLRVDDGAGCRLVACGRSGRHDPRRGRRPIGAVCGPGEVGTPRMCP